MSRWREPGAEVEHSALPIQAVEGATRLSHEGSLLSWAATKRFGAGRVTVATIDLRNLRSSPDRQAPLWATLMGMSAPGLSPALRPPEQVPARVLEHERSRRSFAAGRLALLLALGAACCTVAAVVARRRRDDDRLLSSAPWLGLVAALPLVGASFVSRAFEDRAPFVIEEHFAAAGATRTSTILEPASGATRIATLPLAGWPPRLLTPSLVAGQPLGIELHGGPEASLRGLRPARMPGLALLSERWDEGEAPFAFEVSPEGEPLVRNLSGRDLREVHVLEGATITRLGRLDRGAAVALGERIPAGRDSPPYLALEPAMGRLRGLGVAGVVAGESGGLLGRPTAGVVVAWLEEGR